MRNMYQPKVMIIEEIIPEAPEVKTFRLRFQDPAEREGFTFRAGQFGEFSLFGEGEGAFCLTSSPVQKSFLEFTIKGMDRVTKAFHKLNPGDLIGFRGPYGNWFPMEAFKGSNLIFIGSETGLIPLRSLILNCLDVREYFGQLTILYGAKSATDHLYKREIEKWAKRGDLTLIKTVDSGGDEPDWNGRAGLVPVIMREIGLSAHNCFAITCGPPDMIKFAILRLEAMGFTSDQIMVSLPMKMKCGLGKCGQCRIGKYYVCKDGPVFTYAQLFQFPNEW
jgi:sulfhydrogenase subunit gamma (sulfur reductase)